MAARLGRRGRIRFGLSGGCPGRRQGWLWKLREPWQSTDLPKQASTQALPRGSANAERRWLAIALASITPFLAVEIVIGVIAQPLALILDAVYMLTGAVSIVLALLATRLATRPAGGYTYSLKRAEILSAQADPAPSGAAAAAGRSH
ncbi:cation transporter [Streptomyces violaceoruber]